MKSFARVLSAACIFAASGPAWAAASQAWTRAYYYQFESAEAASKAVVAARIDYVAGGELLNRQRASFRAIGTEPITMVLDDPLAFMGARSFDELRIEVFVGEKLVAGFDAAAFRAYNALLQSQQPQALARAYEAHLVDDGDVGELFEVPLGARASALSAVTCQAACQSDYRECTQTCWGQGCQQCPRLRTECLAACTTDTDGDGLLDTADNCPTTPNPGQANCDGDSRGDACDVVNATYVVVSPEQTCMTDKDEHVGYDSFEHHVEWLERDTSACGAPDVWRRRIRAEENFCYNIGDEACCYGLTASLNAVGSIPGVWCTAWPQGWRNHDLCYPNHP